MEEIIKRGPDLILSVGDVTEGTASDADRVQGLLNIPVVLVDSALVRTGDAYRFVGELLGEEERAEFLQQCMAIALSSDAFFPFRDNIDRAAASGVKYVVEPGGSVRDSDVIAAADQYGMVINRSRVERRLEEPFTRR